MSPSYPTLLSLISPALALAVLAYFTRLFGKIIADQKPFTDNREWEIELGGIMYMINLSPGLIGVVAALYAHAPSNSWWSHAANFVIVALVLGVIFLANLTLTQKFYLMKIQSFFGSKEFFEWFHKLGKYLPISLASAILFYFGTMEARTENIIWIVLVWPLILYALIALASLYSLRRMMKQERIGVDVHFIDKSIPTLRDVMILKFNDDNVRLRQGDKVIILNKAQVLKFEMVTPETYLPYANRAGKNLA